MGARGSAITMDDATKEPPKPARLAEKFDPARLAYVSIFLLEKNSEVANGMRTMLRGVGLGGIRGFLTPDEMEPYLASAPPDVVILSENQAAEIFEVTKRIRRAVLGKNPFTVILLLVNPDNSASIAAAVKSGADSALVKPVAAGQLVDRITQLAFNRPLFIATTDYIGPERRAAGRSSDIPLIQTINTLRYKLERRTIPPEALERAISVASGQIWLGQLHAQSLKLKWSCDNLLEAHSTGKLGEDVTKPLRELVEGLEEASATSRRIGQAEMVNTCHQLAQEIEMLANDTTGLNEHKIKMLGMIPIAFENARQRLAPTIPQQQPV